VVPVLRGLRERVGELLGGGREQVTGLAARADPASGSMLGAMRPGTVAAVVAGCLSVGSTATYCAFEGLPVSLGGGHHERPAPKREAAKAPTPTVKARSVAATVAPTTTTTASTTAKASSSSASKKKATKKDRQRAAAKKVARATAPEFGVEGTGTATPSTATTASQAPSGSTSASNGGWSQEFGP
jgi:hypothetical protein